MNESESQRLYNIAKEKGFIDKKEYIKFKGTGKHTLKFIKDGQTDGTNYHTKKPEKKMRYTFEEDGTEKTYETAIYKKDDDGEETEYLASFIKQMNQFNYGDALVAEYTPIEGTFKGFIKVNPADSEEEEVPIIDENDSYSADM